MSSPIRAVTLGLTLGLSLCGCGGKTLDAGSTRPHGSLPVDARSPIILTNDNVSDNWQGEYALLLANGAGPELLGIVVSTGGQWTNISANVQGWRDLIQAARDSGLQAPNPITSISNALVRPSSGLIEDTSANGSEGANFIVDESARLSRPYRPVVVATGGRLTDVADAYLIDPTVADRIVVVSSLGSSSDTGGSMGPPNGEMDPWADVIVTTRLRYVQVSGFYDQLTDVPDSRVSELPSNAFGSWIADKRTRVFGLPEAADQVSVAAVAIPNFAVTVDKVAAGTLGSKSRVGPDLTSDANGPIWLVRESNGSLATDTFWRLLLESNLFSE